MMKNVQFCLLIYLNDCRNAKLHFQMTFSLPLTSCLRKLPIYFNGASTNPLAVCSTNDKVGEKEA